MGEGEERENLEKIAQKLGISDSVIFEGYVEDARSHLSGIDIFVLPSRSENFPYVVLEAGLANLPVIASRVGGMPEIIETGLNGTLVEKENVEELFSTLVLLAEDSELRERLGNNLKTTVREKFSLEQMFETTFKLY